MCLEADYIHSDIGEPARSSFGLSKCFSVLASSGAASDFAGVGGAKHGSRGAALGTILAQLPEWSADVGKTSMRYAPFRPGGTAQTVITGEAP